jgi:tetratricopeptide (TPR) repeat protein
MSSRFIPDTRLGMLSRTKSLARLFTKAHMLHRAGKSREALLGYRDVLTASGLFERLAPHTEAIAEGKPFDARAARQIIESNEYAAGALHYCALISRSLNDHARHNGVEPREEETARMMALSVILSPGNAASVHNFAKFKHDRGELDDARQLYTNAVTIDPQQGDSWTNLGNVWGELGNRLRAEACWYRALECPTPTPEAKLNIGFLKLLKGNYAEGWRDYEARWDSTDFLINYGRPELRAPRWKGERVHGTLYLHQEQGAGDALMMARYIPLAMERCERVVLEVIRGLVDLFGAMFPGVEIVARGDTPPRHAAQLPMLSLPYIFGTTLETIPDPVRFWPTTADGAPVQAEPGRIGLCWRGSTTHTKDRVRSLSFEACFPLLDLAASHGLAFQSLQFGYDTSPPLEAFPNGDFLETARQIARCSCVVTCDTSVAHLAGSMGVPTWVLLPYVAEFRWLEDIEVSPWYGSAVLWRQNTAGDWGEVIDRVAKALVSQSDEPARTA